MLVSIGLAAKYAATNVNSNPNVLKNEVKNKQSHFGGGGGARSAVIYIILKEKQANN